MKKTSFINCMTFNCSEYFYQFNGFNVIHAAGVYISVKCCMLLLMAVLLKLLMVRNSNLFYQPICRPALVVILIFRLCNIVIVYCRYLFACFKLFIM